MMGFSPVLLLKYEHSPFICFGARYVETRMFPRPARFCTSNKQVFKNHKKIIIHTRNKYAYFMEIK